ncbi:MAG: response regulator [Gammaproteobacteria bacterium]|nr:response regulator [Gammaproteobacteria bacterium]
MADVLIIEDSPTDAQAYSGTLREHGYTVSMANNGEEGMALAAKLQPDLILMDIVMPGINGFQATRELGKQAETTNIPIIMLSTKDQQTDRIWGLRQGAVDYLVKPISRRELVESVQSALALP